MTTSPAPREPSGSAAGPAAERATPPDGTARPWRRGLTGLALVASVACAALLPFTFFQTPSVLRSGRQSTLMANAVNGCIAMAYIDGPSLDAKAGKLRDRSSDWFFYWAPRVRRGHDRWWLALRPTYSHFAPPRATQTIYILSIPLWIPCVALAAPAVARRLLRNRRRPPHTCRVCGYDLRATPLRCPECGTNAMQLSPTPPPDRAH
jgi:rubrerythrin